MGEQFPQAFEGGQDAEAAHAISQEVKTAQEVIPEEEGLLGPAPVVSQETLRQPYQGMPEGEIVAPEAAQGLDTGLGEQDVVAETDIFKMTPEQRRSQPIEGVPVSKPMAALAAGKYGDTIASVDEAISDMTLAAEEAAGATSISGLAATQAAMEAENEAAAVEAAEITETNKALKEAGEPEVDVPQQQIINEQTVYARTLLESVPAEVSGQIQAGDIGDVRLRESRDKRRTISDAAGLRSAIANQTQRLGELGEMVREKIATILVAETDRIMDSNGIEQDGDMEQAVGRLMEADLDESA